MSKKSFILNYTLGIITGLFILPSILDWLGVPFSFENVLTFVFGEPNTVNRIVVVLLGLMFVLFITLGFYKRYKKST